MTATAAPWLTDTARPAAREASTSPASTVNRCAEIGHEVPADFAVIGME